MKHDASLKSSQVVSLLQSLRIRGRTFSTPSAIKPFLYPDALIDSKWLTPAYLPDRFAAIARPPKEIVRLEHGLQSAFLNINWTNSDVLEDGLFIRGFYNRLFNLVRKNRQTILIGTPGTGKSMFRYYYLMRLLGTLPPIPRDIVKAGPQPWCNLVAEDQDQDQDRDQDQDQDRDQDQDSEPQAPQPLCVVWQEGNSTKLYIYQPSHAGGYKVEAFHVAHPEYILNQLRPEQSIYIFDPTSTSENVTYVLACPTLATCAPHRARYKHLMNHGGAPLYMPSHTKDELLTLAAFLEKTAPLERKQLLSAALVSSRYEKFGGILRHVVPRSQSYLNLALWQRETAIKQTKKETLLSAGATIDPQESRNYISDFLMHFKVDKSYRHFTLEFSSPSTEEELWCHLSSKKELPDLLDGIALAYQCRTPDRARFAVKEAVFQLLQTPCDQWKVSQSTSACHTTEYWTKLALKPKVLPLPHEGRADPNFAIPGSKSQSQKLVEFEFEFEFEEGYLYNPELRNFPFIDMFFVERIPGKVGRNRFIGLSVSVSKEKCFSQSQTEYNKYRDLSTKKCFSQTAYSKCRDLLGMSQDDELEFWLVTDHLDDANNDNAMLPDAKSTPLAAVGVLSYPFSEKRGRKSKFIF